MRQSRMGQAPYRFCGTGPALWFTLTSETMMVSVWIPGPSGVTITSPLPMEDRARSVHVPGGEEPKSPVLLVTTSAVNSPGRVEQPHERAPNGSAGSIGDLPGQTVSFSTSTPAGKLLPLLGCCTHTHLPLRARPGRRPAIRTSPAAVVVLTFLVAQQLPQDEPGGWSAHRYGSRRWSLSVETGLGVEPGQLIVALEGAVLVGSLCSTAVADRTGDGSGTCLLLRQVRGGEDLPLNSSGLRTSTRFFLTC